ncbi:MAG: UbiA family prenyltransferase [Planctomycetes bacterium]|nr:UbiA family prenyltransferase [Planctomycetota bacterium]MCB9870155.1 UbiA family prenyltransferase [Planctomycetota bacterium]
MPPSPRTAARRIWIRFLLYPAHTLPTAAGPVLVAAGLAVRDDVFAPLPLALALLGSWLIHVAGVLADNHELLRRHHAVPEHPELLCALRDGTLTLRQLRGVIVACLVAAVLAGIYPVLLAGIPALVVGAVGVLASLGYASGPRPYAALGLADPIFLLMFGVVAVVGSYAVQAAAVRPDFAWTALPHTAYVVGLPVGCLITAVLVIDDIRDRHFDADKRWRTTAARFGLTTSRIEWVALAGLAYAMPLWFWLGLGFGPLVLLPWLTAPAAFVLGRAVCRFDSTADLLRMTPRTSILSVAFAGLLGVGLAAG